jgi:hypothetical protein
LKPYWGKPAVRNFREGDGNVGIIRSPLRAIALPDYGEGLATHTDPESVEGVMGDCHPYSDFDRLLRTERNAIKN